MLVAIIKDNVVSDIKELDPESAEYNQLATTSQCLVDITDYDPKPIIGDVFSGNAIVVSPTSMKITRLAMRQRFTTAELAAIHTASKTNVIVELLLDNVRVSTFIDLGRPDTIAGVNALVAYGIITSERADIILNTKPTDVEKYIEGR